MSLNSNSITPLTLHDDDLPDPFQVKWGTRDNPTYYSVQGKKLAFILDQHSVKI